MTDTIKLYQCIGCGHLHMECVSSCDCGENPAATYSEWVAKPTQAASAVFTPLTDSEKQAMWNAATIELPSQSNCYKRGIVDAERAHNLRITSQQDDTALLRQALEALGCHADYGRPGSRDTETAKAIAAITAIRTRLGETK